MMSPVVTPRVVAPVVYVQVEVRFVLLVLTGVEAVPRSVLVVVS